MKKSITLIMFPPGTKGRKACRNLDDDAVSRAIAKSKDAKHQQKFLSRSQGDALLLSQIGKVIGHSAERHGK